MIFKFKYFQMLFNQIFFVNEKKKNIYIILHTYNSIVETNVRFLKITFDIKRKKNHATCFT